MNCISTKVETCMSYLNLSVSKRWSVLETSNTILNRLFTQNVFQELINGHHNKTYGAIVQRYVPDNDDKNNGELISEIYRFMSQSYRNEYFYKNTLLNKLLLGRHSVYTTTALTQIPVGKSKADFVLINGNAIVYEIKSELDSFERLETQLWDYYKAFDRACVVTSEHYYEKLFSILCNKPVGICVLSKRNTISRKLSKEAVKDNSNLDYLAIFKILHKNEYEAILMQYFGELPKATQAFHYEECYSMFSQIPILEAHSMAIKQLKKRNYVISRRIYDVPYELKSLMYFSCPSIKDFDSLDKFLQKRFGG